VQVNVKVKDIVTVHTDENGRLDQPLIEVTLEVNKVGETEKHEIKFSEMLSTIADMDNAQLKDHVEMLVQSYTRTAYKGQQELNSETRDWARMDQAIGKEFVVEI